MERLNRFTYKQKKVTSSVLIFVLAVMLFLPYLPPIPEAIAKAVPGDTVIAYGDGFHHYCIDDHTLVSNGAMEAGDEYTYVLPSTRLSDTERAYIFWATMSFQANLGSSPAVNNAVNKINFNAPGEGLLPMMPAMTELDLKKVIHVSETKKKYPWLDMAVQNPEKYMQMGGILGAAASTQGGGGIPAVLADSTSLANAYKITSNNSFTIQFDESGADAGFITSVPIEFSTDGEHWSPDNSNGWTYVKGTDSIQFSNPNPESPKVLIRFHTVGTAYTAEGGYSSVEEAYENALELWICTKCCGTHKAFPKVTPLEQHQRLVFLELESVPVEFFAAIGGDPVLDADVQTSMEFQIYRHEEDMKSTYNVQLYKYDHETGQPLEGSRFDLYERFDDKDQIDTVRDGPVHIYEGGAPYASYHTNNPVIWDGFRKVTSLITDDNGHAKRTMNRGYHYDKTFCDGHPAPVFAAVPEPIMEPVQPVEGEGYDGSGEYILINGGDIELAKSANAAVADQWLTCVMECEAKAVSDFEGVHFHWLMDGVDSSMIEDLAGTGGSEGEVPNAGTTTSADGETAYEESGCRQDSENTYKKFISLKYSYTFEEITAREGYIRHNLHPDDLPVEVITTDASENGANAIFAGIYDRDIDPVAVTYKTAGEIQEAREKNPSVSEEETKSEKESLFQRAAHYIQKVITWFTNDSKDNNSEEPEDSIPTEEELSAAISMNPALTASASNAVSAETGDTEMATPSDAKRQFYFLEDSNAPDFLSGFDNRQESGAGGRADTFHPAYEEAASSQSVGDDVPKGPSGSYSHCSDADGEGNSWRIYDHRTEGEIHINKRDLELEGGENSSYDSYGDTQGDAALEGAVYGLFAAQDLQHPDGTTGTVYKANNLVAVAATDKNGDASFLVGTEAPGYTYHYETGAVEKTEDNWADTAPGNLYRENVNYDDYTADNNYIRTYYDNQSNNGNCWIGRPLLMGDYYVKELTRSEGYELSVSNRQHDLTNRGQDTDVTIPQGSGYAVITRNLYAEAQISDNPTGEVGSPDVNELFFSAKSKETGVNGFDLVFQRLPADTRIYRKDTGTKTVEVETGTGIYEKVLLTNSDGSPKYIVAEHNSQYPRYNPDGTLQTKEVPTDYIAADIAIVTSAGLEEQKVISIMERAEPAMTAEEVADKIAEEFSAASLDFVKGKLEAALRQNGKNTPSVKLPDSGTRDYSNIYVGVYDRGVREGDPDHYGITGVTPGEPAAYTAYGAPVQKVEILKITEAGTPLTTGEAILSLADYYNTHAFYTYGGIDLLKEEADRFIFHVYTGVTGSIPDYMVMGTDPEHDSTIYHKVKYIPDDSAESPRLIYASYSNNPNRNSFGVYTDLTVGTAGGRDLASATLVTDAVADTQGHLTSRMIRENVYFLKGETVLDKDGTPIQAFEYREILETKEQEVETSLWTELPTEAMDGRLVTHVAGTYTDAFGTPHEDGEEQSYSFRAVVPEKTFQLSAEDIHVLGTASGWSAGDIMGGALYYTGVTGAGVRAYLDFDNSSITGDNSYVKSISLIYPKDAHTWQDGDGIPGTGTRVTPVGVQERIIKQKVKVTKDIRSDEDSTYKMDTVQKMDNFRFKIYLKSNLTRLYRDEDGAVCWQNRRGEDLAVDGDGTITDYTKPYPALVQDLFTRVLHRTDPLFKNSRDAVTANDILYDYADHQINDDQNPGFTAILETIRPGGQTVGQTGEEAEETYNYDKFFHALAVANQDKWDDGAPTYTSWDPIGNEANRVPAAIENARVSDMVRQFAIRWYLETEGSDGSVRYPNELHDEALHQAIIKAQNYLKPFFAYDLDAIYSIRWDSSPDGGRDGDETTLSADLLHGDVQADSDGYYYGISAYLPYGTYVIAEQQPRYAELEDFANRHYRIDQPREIQLPSVYAGYEGSRQDPEEFNPYYRYFAADTPEALSAKYELRFNEERHIINAQNRDGTFQIYKYGLSIPMIHNGDAGAGAGDYFALTQDAYKPFQNHYNAQDDRTTGDVPYYLSEGLSGREAVSGYYRYSSVAESAGLEEETLTMTGIQTAYDGYYAPMLIPWSVTEPEDEIPDTKPLPSGESNGQGYGYGQFTNDFYTSRLRIEKLDSETHESILHDSAIFHIYAAERDETPDGTGRVKFYTKDTTITGSREFLESMGASHITPLMRSRSSGLYGVGSLFSGLVPAGTPVCREKDQIILTDEHGKKTGSFQSFTTTRDGLQRDKNHNTTFVTAEQNTGYLETPKPLGAGVYVLCEVKPPSGYVRTKPIAIEIYSDAVTYYKEGNPDKRVAAAIYEWSSSPLSTDGGGQQIADMARINVENTPIKLSVEKRKEPGTDSAQTTADKTVTYKVSGRIDGSLTQIGSNPDYEYAYENGDYLGYAWKKGTLEYLKARQESGEAVEIVFQGRNFSGYGYVTRQLETADDSNPYVTGAVMTLFEALELKPSGDSQDHAYEGLVVERSDTGNVIRMYVKQGYAGTRVEFIQEMGEDGLIWTAKTINRPDTDVLCYDLDSLDIFQEELVDGRKILYGYDRNHRKVALEQLESDKEHFDKTDQEHSIFAFKGGMPYLEFTGGDFTRIRYSAGDKSIAAQPETRIYHMDREGNRDALVDPHTGMAYVLEPSAGEEGGADRVLVWPVHIVRNEQGDIIARDKLTTSRPATIGENQDGYQEQVTIEPIHHLDQEIKEEDKPSFEHWESGYISGTWKSEAGEQSHGASTLTRNQDGQNRNDDILINNNPGSFLKELNPVSNRCGLIEYYQQSDETYQKATELFDRNSTPVRIKNSDHLKRYNDAAYIVEDTEKLYDREDELYHRQGEGYVLENTWITSQKTPNDPFDDTGTDGQPDLLKRVPAGTYIMEELKAPPGYVKGMPTGITVEETALTQSAAMTDKTTKVEISKVDGTKSCRYAILDMEHLDSTGNPTVTGYTVEGKGRYSHQLLKGIQLVLYEADRIYTDNREEHPKGWYLKKKPDAEPFCYPSTDSTPTDSVLLQAVWTTDGAPVYLEGIPKGDYILEEEDVPSGYVKSEPVEISVTNTPEVQLFAMHNDHTKLEVEKYTMAEGEKHLMNGAEFTLYEAQTDAEGNVLYEDGSPLYKKDRIIDTWVSNDASDYTSGFMPEFEKMYKQFGTAPGTGIGWSVEKSAVKNTESDGVWVLDDGRRVVEVSGSLLFPPGMSLREEEAIQRAWESRLHNEQTIRWQEERSGRYVSHTQIDHDGTEGSTCFPLTAAIRYRTDRGEDVNITVYQESTDRQGRTFTFEYQFDWRRLAHVNETASSCLTEDGRRRLDYLPAGANYVLVETGVPAGYEKVADRLIPMGSTEHVQLYSVENKMRELLISKTGSHMEQELYGATMALYRAAEDGSYDDDPSGLMDLWISGTDGTYSDLDVVNNRIPEGYEEGDRKPHAIRGLEEGTYYLAELSSPPYYIKIEPMRLEYQPSSQPQIVRVPNVPVTGELEIIKQSADGILLTGVVFEVNAYKPGSRIPVWSAAVSDRNGIVLLKDMPVGEPGADGQIVPYTYKVREVIPPQGHAVNTQLHTFQFAPQPDGGSYEPGSTAKISLIIKNEKTKLYIEKRDFEGLPYEDEYFIEGALLAVYELHGRDDKGAWIYDDEEDLIESWWTKKEEKRHLIEGLTGGRSYFLKELQAPPGYAQMEPAVFTVSRDGRNIQHVTDSLGAVGVCMTESTITVSGRYVSRVEMALQDEAGEEVTRWIATGSGCVLTRSDAVKDGGIYVLTEHTMYSDGSDMVTGRTLRRIRFNENGECKVMDRGAVQVELSLLTDEGETILSFVPSEWLPEMVIEYPGASEALKMEGRPYLLREKTSYTDGSDYDSGRWGFTVNEAGEVQGITGYDRKQHIQVWKVDEKTGDALAGARLQLIDAGGSLLEEWESKAQPYEIKTALLPDIRYRIRELSPPEGYLPMKTEDEITFMLTKGDMLLTILVENRPDLPPVKPPEEKPPEIPHEPEEPEQEPPAHETEPIPPFPYIPEEPPQKTGWIRAFYEPTASYPEGLVFRSPGWEFPWAKAGDDTPWSLYGFVFTISAVGSCILLYQKKKNKKRG